MRHRLLILWLLLPVLTGGCVTRRLWSESTFDEWNEPAGDPHLRLFHADRENDFLVAYDEFCERSDQTKPRAYFLHQNHRALANHARPHFVNTNSVACLNHVPVLPQSGTNFPPGFYAVTTTNIGCFNLYQDSHSLGSFALPVYNDGVGRWERIAWTPLTVTADLTIVGGVLVLIGWNALGESQTVIRL